MSIEFRYAARSDVGLTRKNNQDSGYAGPHLAVLADGMGGPAGGDIASSVAVAHLAPLDNDAHGADDLLDLLRDALTEAHAELIERSAKDSQLQGLGTTCIAVLRSGNKLAMVHVGDSRAYLLRDQVPTQVTTDHSFVQYLVQSGQLTPEEAEHHPQRSVLLRVLGDSSAEVTLDESVREARIGDRWLLCSDGLSGVVSADTIAEVLNSEEDLTVCAEKLVALALRGGGPDNITTVLFDVVDGRTTTTSDSGVPQIVGAAATDRLAATRGTDSAAGRAAALLSTPEATPAEEEDEEHPRWRWWPLAGLVALLAVLAGGIFAGYNWTQSQYYLAEKGSTVAIYRGIPQTLGPWKLSRVQVDTGILLTDLPEYQRDRLKNPVVYSSKSAVEAAEERLRREVATHKQQVSGDKTQAGVETPATPASGTPAAAESGTG